MISPIPDPDRCDLTPAPLSNALKTDTKLVEMPDEDTMAKSEQTVNRWFEEIEDPCEFETLLDLNCEVF